MLLGVRYAVAPTSIKFHSTFSPTLTPSRHSRDLSSASRGCACSWRRREEGSGMMDMITGMSASPTSAFRV